MPWFPPLLARIARFTVLVAVALILLWGAKWPGLLFPSSRQYLPRRADPADIAVPPGYRVDVLAQGLDAPSTLEITADGSIYIAESGYGGAYAATAGYEGTTVGRILRLHRDGSRTLVAGGFAPPLSGFAHDRQGNLIVSHLGAITAVTPQGRRDLVSGLPSLGDHKNNNVAIGTDGKIYFGQGTATNSGVVGLDNWVQWTRFFAAPHDIPCANITLRGINSRTGDPRALIPMLAGVKTGAYSPFGFTSYPGQVVAGQVPCNGSIMRVNPDGTGLAVVAWGLRNPFGLRFGPDGQLYATDNGFDPRGSRPIGSHDLLHRIRPGAWYGWPDYWNGTPVTELHAGGREQPQLLLAKAPAPPERALVELGHHAAAAGFDFAPATFGYAGHAFVAQFGSGFPATTQDPAYAGFNVIAVDPQTRKATVFAGNRRPGPTSLEKGAGGFERPVSVRFGPDGAMYVLDWGHMSVTPKGPYHTPDTGVLWRISRQGAATLPYRPLTTAGN